MRLVLTGPFRRTMRSMSLSPNYKSKKLLWSGIALVAVLSAVRLVSRRAGHLEPLVPGCPIRWATATYGTDPRFHTWHGHPFTHPTLGSHLVRVEMALDQWTGHRASRILGFEGSFLNNRSPEPVLVVRVLVPPKTNFPPQCHYRLTVADARGLIAVSNGGGGSRTVEEYQFRRLPIKSEKG